MEIYLNKGLDRLTNEEIIQALDKSVEGLKLSKVLLIPPDFTRFYSNAGFITNHFYHLFTSKNIHVDILPALGTHVAMSDAELKEMYGDIPLDRFIKHNWKEDVITLGQVPGEFCSQISEGLWTKSIDVQINKLVMDPSYDLVLSIGQVVPHEVVGMANHAKNLLVGCGGNNMINASHMVGALYGIERVMGKDHTPVRQIFDYAYEHYLANRNIMFVLTVTTNSKESGIATHGLFIGTSRKGLENAIELALKVNFTAVDEDIKKCIVNLDEKEFQSTWLGNKAIYRTRMAIANDGDLYILAKGVKRFGEDEKIDKLVRKYGYVGRISVINLLNENKDLQENMSAAAHLIHGSSEGRFRIHYCVKNISKEEIKSVNYIPEDYDDIYEKYDVKNLKEGYNIINGEKIFYISNPALGLWIAKERLSNGR